MLKSRELSDVIWGFGKPRRPGIVEMAVNLVIDADYDTIMRELDSSDNPRDVITVGQMEHFHFLIEYISSFSEK